MRELNGFSVRPPAPVPLVEVPKSLALFDVFSKEEKISHALWLYQISALDNIS